MELYGKILNIAMPIFLLLVIFEKIYGKIKGNDTVPVMDAISSLSSGMTNVVKDVLGLSVAIISYKWMVQHLAIFTIENTIAVYIIAFIALDFYGYWVHRLSHQINIFWNKHAIHHSSEEFNLACALRQSISSFINLFTFFLIPAAIVGVPDSVIAIVAPIQLFAQFWYHTQHINKMGFLEKIIVTPSHHRVHHAINPEYLDKNHSQIFIIWDKLFGTFQEELPNIKPVYGITRPAQTFNPIKINFQHLWLLAKDAWQTKNLKDKFIIWFKPTGWRPADVAEKFPVKKIEDVYNFEKYSVPNSKFISTWSGIQLIINLFFISFFFAHIAQIGSPNLFFYGAFVFISIYSITELMDFNPKAFIWEGVRLIMGIFMITQQNDWFGLNTYFGFGSNAVLVYLIISFLVVVYLSKVEVKKLIEAKI